MVTAPLPKRQKPDNVDEVLYPPEGTVREKVEVVARTRPNSVAGAPNFGNPAINFIHNTGPLPKSIYTGHLYTSLRRYVPSSEFDIIVSDRLINDSWQQILISYREEAE